MVDLGDAGGARRLRRGLAAAQVPGHVETPAAPRSRIATVIDFLDAFYGGGMVPADPDLAWRARLWDRIFDSI